MELVIQYSRLFTSRHKSRSIGVFRFQFLVSDSWSLVPGFWFLVPGFWFLVSGSWFLVPGSWFLVSGFWFPVPGFLLWYPSQPVWNGTCNTIFEVVHIQAQKQKFLEAGAIDMLLTCTSENTLGYHFLFKWKRVCISFKKQQLT